MICRGGIVVGGWGDKPAPRPALLVDESQAATGTSSWSRMLLMTALTAWLLATFGPPAASLPPNIESDYCYQLIAADRMFDGHGLTSLQPVAPRQPWSWAYDFGFLTQWPAGFSLMVAFFRLLFGLDTAAALWWINLLACSAALVGWYAWLRRNLGCGASAACLALGGAMMGVPFGLLKNPSTDVLLLAALPWVLLMASVTLHRASVHAGARHSTHRIVLFGFMGVAAGMLVAFRYAAVFLPLAVCATLLVLAFRRKALTWSSALACVLGALLPVIGLLAVNRTLGYEVPLQAQLNLGTAGDMRFSWQYFVTAWWHLSDLGNAPMLGGYPNVVHGAWAMGPAIVLLVVVTIPATRKALVAWVSHVDRGLSIAVMISLLALLIGVTALFGSKFDFVNLPRYYLPVRPVFFMLMAGPILLIRRPWFRGAAALIGLALALTVHSDWRWQTRHELLAARERTSYGREANCFTPGAESLFAWLREQDMRHTLVFSNFHDYITLETRRVAYPIPPDSATLLDWVARASAARGIQQARLLFVMDPDSRWRRYWHRPLAEVVASLGLFEDEEAPKFQGARVFQTAFGAKDRRAADFNPAKGPALCLGLRHVWDQGEVPHGIE